MEPKNKDGVPLFLIRRFPRVEDPVQVFGKKEEPALFEIEALIKKHGWKPMLIERLKSNGYDHLIPAEFEKKSPSLFDQDIPLDFQDLKKLA